ncbi:MAG: sugar transferase [Paracoccaceae bacterium]|nr:sugar transferase [Paracoccaceae bacterium]
MPTPWINRDWIVACLLAPIIFAVLALLFVIVVTVQGRPFLYRSERMRDADTPFHLYKIRTMHPACASRETPLGGGDAARVTAIGGVLRRLRLDELPQIVNVLRGDMCFIGPRPPLRHHVDAFPDQYRRLLRMARPGITGLATVVVHRREEKLLSECRSIAETETVYARRCLPIKLRLDYIYASKRSLLLDMVILWRTFSGLSLVRHSPRHTGTTSNASQPALRALMSPASA